MHDLTNEEILVLMQQGHENAFEELYNRYWKKLYNAIYSRTKSAEWAEGIVQDFFTSLWLKREKLQITGTFEAYAFTAVRYHLFHYIQKEVTRKKYKDSLKSLPASHSNSTEEAVLLNDLNNRLSGAIARLPEKCRSVFELSRRQHKTNREIAEELGISEKTVENHLTRALRHLRLSLKEIFLFLF
ncbi:RNA polymerase sigma-70 factor [Chitinophaga sp. GCM10012297]|uniref:RNA polymerase sigma-70 factor n=1 Tax=Chitinophaga chungangae TaxID=2821488 RepID=A0ABS3YFM4_9BACT|nr:RNA polymerase sigma-70 factor [Chitinophaga chungangae]MBO9153481.1 RNA polymerase sigma-70 factor [Chitinophaga chungangae]